MLPPGAVRRCKNVGALATATWVLSKIQKWSVRLAAAP